MALRAAAVVKAPIAVVAVSAQKKGVGALAKVAPGAVTASAMIGAARRIACFLI